MSDHTIVIVNGVAVIYQRWGTAGVADCKGEIISGNLIVIAIFINFYEVRPRRQGIRSAEPVDPRKKTSPPIVVIFKLVQAAIIQPHAGVFSAWP